MSCPFKIIDPSSGVKKPVAIFKRVDFPVPFPPDKPILVPSLIEEIIFQLH